MRLILSFYLFFSYNVLGSNVEQLTIKEGVGDFYPTLGRLLVTFQRPQSKAIFGDLNTVGVGRTRVIKVKVSELELGLSKGDIIYHVRLNKKMIVPYVVKEYVNILLYSGMLKTKNHWNQYYIILSDDLKDIEQAKKDIDYIVQRDGFAYIGKTFDFSKASFKKFSLSPFTGGKLPPHGSFWKGTKLSDVRHTILLNNVLFFNEESILIPLKGKKTVYGGEYFRFLYSSLQNYIELITLNSNQYILPTPNGPLKLDFELLLIEPSSIYRILSKSQDWE